MIVISFYILPFISYIICSKNLFLLQLYSSVKMSLVPKHLFCHKFAHTYSIYPHIYLMNPLSSYKNAHPRNLIPNYLLSPYKTRHKNRLSSAVCGGHKFLVLSSLGLNSICFHVIWWTFLQTLKPHIYLGQNHIDRIWIEQLASIFLLFTMWCNNWNNGALFELFVPYVPASLQSTFRYQAVPWEHQNVSLTLHMPTHLCIYKTTIEMWLLKSLRGQSDIESVFLQSEASFPCCFLWAVSVLRATDSPWVPCSLGHQHNFLNFFFLIVQSNKFRCFPSDDKINSCVSTKELKKGSVMHLTFCILQCNGYRSSCGIGSHACATTDLWHVFIF